MNQKTICSCYVSRLIPEIRFGVRRGAHSLTCPMYRESLDSVDREHDKVFRASYERIDDERSKTPHAKVAGMGKIVQPGPSEAVKKLPQAEECIAWAAQQGYCYAIQAAEELAAITGREMFLDQPYYNNYLWRDKQ